MSDTLDGDVDITVEVGALSQLLIGALPARDLAFEGKLSANEEWLEFFDILYPEQKHILTNGGNMSWKTYTVKEPTELTVSKYVRSAFHYPLEIFK